MGDRCANGNPAIWPHTRFTHRPRLDPAKSCGTAACESKHLFAIRNRRNQVSAGSGHTIGKILQRQHGLPGWINGRTKTLSAKAAVKARSRAIDMNEQKIKQDLNIGANIRRIRKMRNFGQTELVRLLQLDGIAITRKTLVQIEIGRAHV